MKKNKIDYPKMDPVVKAKWLEALRSRKYKQGTGTLKRLVNGSEQYCCLGVLCEVAEIKSYHTGTIDDANKVKIGLSGSAQNELIDRNDFREQKFYQIARWIERNL